MDSFLFSEQWHTERNIYVLQCSHAFCSSRCELRHHQTADIYALKTCKICTKESKNMHKDVHAIQFWPVAAWLLSLPARKGKRNEKLKCTGEHGTNAYLQFLW